MTDQQVVIITGAGSGIGRETALLLAESGYATVLVGRKEHALKDTAKQIHIHSGLDALTHVLPADMCDPASSKRIIEQSIHTFKRIDALANIAGHAPLNPIEENTPQLARQCIDTNLTAVINLTSAAWPVLKKQKHGIIVNVSSMSSIDPYPGFSIYASAKAGLNMFTHCTAVEGAQFGILAVAVAPGAVETAMLRNIFPQTQIPMDKTLDPVEVAAVIRDLITGRRTFTSGRTIPLPSPD